MYCRQNQQTFDSSLTTKQQYYESQEHNNRKNRYARFCVTVLFLLVGIYNSVAQWDEVVVVQLDFISNCGHTSVDMWRLLTMLRLILKPFIKNSTNLLQSFQRFRIKRSKKIFYIIKFLNTSPIASQRAFTELVSNNS